jgi:hypothetical protein
VTQTDTGRAVAILVMVVGIGFLSLLIGSVSERFVSGGVEEEVAEVERAVEADVERAEAEVLAEIRAISSRLRQLEARLERGSG